MELKGKKILVVGAGKSGEESARFLCRQGAQVAVSETLSEKQISADLIRWAREQNVYLETGGHKTETFLKSDLIVISPGVPLEVEPVRAARNRGIPVIGELELASRFITEPVIAITGTNGKSTTTTLIGHILSCAGKTSFVGGNLGQPLIGHVNAQEKKDFVVVEVSSFQLDTTERFHADIALLLNITEDHLDRYASFDDYASSKFRIFSNQGESDAAIINGEDPMITAGLSAIPSRIFAFGHKRPQKEGAFVEGKVLFCRLEGKEERYSLADFKLAGEHNLENVMAAVLAGRLCGCGPEAVQNALDTFRGLPHRTEFVCEVNGVSFFDDSKGTNVGSVVKSLAGFRQPVILIAGGRDKGGSYKVLEQPVKEKVKALILIGEAKEKIRPALGHLTRTLEADSLPMAVEMAYAEASPGDVVLLSPACASFDMFRSYAERGDIFQKAALGLRSRR